MSGGRFRSLRRSFAGVSPVRTPTTGLVRQRVAEAVGRVADARQRRAQVLLDVDRERAQRRDVEHAGAAVGARAAARPPAGRSPTGTPRASCPIRWARGSACGRRRRSPSIRGTAPPWARRTTPRTSRERRGRRPSGSPVDATAPGRHGCYGWIEGAAGGVRRRRRRGAARYDDGVGSRHVQGRGLRGTDLCVVPFFPSETITYRCVVPDVEAGVGEGLRCAGSAPTDLLAVPPDLVALDR